MGAKRILLGWFHSGESGFPCAAPPGAAAAAQLRRRSRRSAREPRRPETCPSQTTHRPLGRSSNCSSQSGSSVTSLFRIAIQSERLLPGSRDSPPRRSPRFAPSAITRAPALRPLPPNRRSSRCPPRSLVERTRLPSQIFEQLRQQLRAVPMRDDRRHASHRAVTASPRIASSPGTTDCRSRRATDSA